jgi:Predicted transcriptional regulators
MGTSYHQFCPVAKAMELLDERWTLLIVRELVAGSERFQRAAPRSAADVAHLAVQAAEPAGPGGVIERRGDGTTSGTS